MALRPNRKRKQIDGENGLTKPKQRMHLGLSDFPRDIVINVLAKLPITTILHCKIVCKEWRDIILDPLFAKEHYDNSRPTLVSHRKTGVNNNKMFMIESYNTMHEHNFKSSKLNVGFAKDFEVVNSCRGLLLLISDRVELSVSSHCCWFMSIYNPLTDEHMRLQERHITPSDRKLVCGLGYSPRTEQYKVVSFSSHLGLFIVEAQTIGTNLWRRIQGPNRVLEKIRPKNNNPVALNGILHWLATGEEVACFDIEKEEFYLMPSPCRGDPAGKYVISIGVLYGSLCINVVELGNIRNGMESWVMKEYGKIESWTKYYVIKNLELQQQQELFKFRILESGDQGKILVLTPSYCLLSYDLSLECFSKKIQVRGINSRMKLIFHFPAFFSLEKYLTE